MKLVKELSIKGTILDKVQLIHYIEKVASSHVTSKNSNKNTYPIPFLRENFEFINKTYKLLNEHVKLNIPINPAGEWLLDNYYIIEETVKTVCKELNLKKYKNLIGIENKEFKGFARIYVLASEIIAYNDNKIDDETLANLLAAYQTKKNLNMEEIWCIGTFMQISIIKNIKEICERIYASQIQKYKVEDIIDRIIEKNSNKYSRNFKNIKNTYNINLNEMKYSFVEYMSYKLKKYGKQASSYLQVLENETQKNGNSVDDIIKKEHFEIALQKVLMENSIKSLKEILRMDFLDIFEKINGVEELLKQDPADVYPFMEYKTKIFYRNAIKQISKKTKISETYITKKALELAKKEKITRDSNEKETHIGYYLIDEGLRKLCNELGINKKIYKNKFNNAKIYVYFSLLIPFIFAIILGILSTFNFGLLKSMFIAILSYIPITEIYMKTVNYSLGKIIKPKIIPKMDLSAGIPDNLSTFVVIPTIVKKGEKVEEVIKKLEVYYIANKSKNIYFALLGDASASNKQNEEYDNDVIYAGLMAVKKLNEKYSQNDFPIFHFLYRKRKWNKSENCFLGWERKRGLLNEFNEYLLGHIKDDFKANTIENWKKSNKEHFMPKIKYIITLDADTNLPINTGLDLIGSMAHILNKPILNKEKSVVIDGYGIIQPRIGIELDASRKSLFTKIYAGQGGIDCYTNAVFDLYQDNFGEGIFTGKGIYDLEIFSLILKKTIPENTVLSHDLLEGSYLRCGLASDILLLDGYPAKFNSFMARLHRWIRGDWQIIKWLNNTIINAKGEKVKNSLNFLSKFKILDNLRRSLLPIFSFVLLLLGIICNFNSFIIGIPILSLTISTFLDIINIIVFKKEIGSEYIIAGKSFAKGINGFLSSVFQALLEIVFLPYKAYLSLNAITKTVYRMFFTKKHLLEWMTAEEAEKNAKTDWFSYYKLMIANVISFFICFIFSIFFKNIISSIFSFLFLIGPFIAWYISKEINKQDIAKTINEKDREFLKNIAEKTWNFFKNYIDEENNFLPPDNFQEDRKIKIAARTSPTNIGLGMLAVISSYDLGEEKLESVINILEKMINSIEKLQKWNGHLYNWYNTNTLEPLIPRYISTVDSGNFIGYLYVVKQFLMEIQNQNDKIIYLEKQVNNIIENTDFSYLYNPKNKLFSIGFNIEENKLTDSYYDLLASEARQASLVAIAKKNVPAKHWNSLSRNLTSLNRYKGLISWSGTAFEYFMPNINIKRYEGSLLDESCKFMLMSQKEYSKKLNIPWGISEAAFNLKDLYSNYQYKAFGIPWIGLKRGLGDEMVVAPYGSILAISDDPKGVLENLKNLKNQNMFGEYGFYESIDYTPSHLKYGQKYAEVKTFMAHHQGLILLSINNFFNQNILQKRFHENPEVKAVDILLQERMPEKAIITKETKEKVEKIKYRDYETYTERIYTKTNKYLSSANCISNENYMVCMDENGLGFSKYKNLYIYRYKLTSDIAQGIIFYIKNIKNKRIWSARKSECIIKTR